MAKVLNCSAIYMLRTVVRTSVLIGVLTAAGLNAQIAETAYRGIGQADLTRNGLNRVQGTELSVPGGIALDSRGGQTRIYISDTGNHRVLGWLDVQSYQTGDVPAIILGQYSGEGSAALGIGAPGFTSPSAIAVDPATGTVFVADTGNHRVLRFADIADNPARVDPDAVYGQDDMAGRLANGSANEQNAMRNPMGVAVDRAGNLWVADTGNHRVLRYPAGMLNLTAPSADIVLGQKSFTETSRNGGSATVTAAGFDSPAALAFDNDGNLYVSDSGNARILRFTPPFSSESSAAVSISMPGGSIAAVRGIAISNSQVYVAVPTENRVIALAISGGASSSPLQVFGQPDSNRKDPNTGVHPRAAAHTLWGASDVRVDAQGYVYIADTLNNRVLRVPPGTRSGDRVWGQADFSSNSINQVKATGLNGPYKVAVDYSQEPFALYVSDTKNHRILIWKDAVRFRTGDPADAVIGQPDLRTAIANAGGSGRQPEGNSLSSPKGIALDGAGNLYVADSGNNRVLRFPRPVNGVVTADLVLGQSGFQNGAANATGPSSLRSPTAVSIAPDGNVFVSDTGNNRVLEFSAGASSGAAAIRVYGQPNFSSFTSPRAISAQTLAQPAGIAVDAAFNLYVADFGSNRVVIYANTRDAAATSNAAVVVIGSDRFDAVSSGTSRTRLLGPSDVALDSRGRIYVADSQNNRVAIFPSLIFLPITDGGAATIVGQTDEGGNTGATAASLSAPAGVFLDRRDTLYVSDSGNHRVMHFLKAANVAHSVFAQASALGRGALVTIEGSDLASSEEISPMPLSRSLAGREVVVGDSVAAPLVSVSPSTIHLQLPSNTPTGVQRVAVRVAGTEELIAGSASSVATYAPGLHSKVTNQDTSTNGENSAALRGTTIRLLGTGQGPVSPAVADGETAPEGVVRTVAVPTTDGSACLTQQPSICVAIGNTFGEVKFSGLAGGAVGVWQLDVQIPENAATGSIPVRAVINGVPSNIVTVEIR